MARGRKKKTIDYNTLKKLTDEYQTISSISYLTGCSIPTVTRALEQYGLRAYRMQRRIMTPTITREVHRLWGERMTAMEIAFRLSISEASVYKALKKKPPPKEDIYFDPVEDELTGGRELINDKSAALLKQWRKENPPRPKVEPPAERRGALRTGAMGEVYVSSLPDEV